MAMEQMWTKVKAELRNKIPDHTYRMWIEPVALCKASDAELVLSCPNPFSRKRLSDQYKVFIEDELFKISGKRKRVSIIVGERENKPSSPKRHARQLMLPNIGTRSTGEGRLRNDFTFDQFVVGGNNDFAYSAALSMAARNEMQQNSLFLISQTGLGKSHLSQAIGHHILSKSPEERVYYVTAEDFTNEMVCSYKNNTINQFKDKYRKNCDVLLLEDVHYLSGKNGTQDELAHTLESLMGANKKIIFSSCYLPADIPKMSTRLKSRLSCSLISNIDAPDYKTRLKILKKKASANSYHIPDEVMQYLASELTEDIRQLKSGLVGVAAKSSLLCRDIDLTLAEGVVKTIVSNRAAITIDSIKKLVCKYYNVNLQDLVSKSRRQSIVRPRQVAMYLMRRYTDQSLQAIGKSFNRYHATALHAMRTVEKGIKANEPVQKHVEFLSRRLEKGQL